MTPWNKLLIFYFTGTGNARATAQWIVDEAESRGIDSKMINIAGHPDLHSININENTLIGFCYPTHGFNAPPIVLRFLRQFPKTKFQNNVFVLNTRAGMKMGKWFTPGLSGLAELLPAFILRTKGFRIVGYRPIDLPSNWISIHPGLKAKVVESIFVRCQRITRQFAVKIFNGKKVQRGLYDLPIDLIISPLALAYYFYGRFILSKTFIATDVCDQCGLCVRECPVNAISMLNEKPYWAYHCESCMHCMNYCPQRAIETPHGFTALIWWVAYTLLPGFVLYLIHRQDAFVIPNGENPDNFIRYLVEIILGTAVIFGAYKLLHLLLRFSFVNKLLRLSSLTSFAFWRRYRAPKNS
jgi:Pyruvate/2-oxoacid:ferredoxin oxidoreductase delta subunit/flavodoxin